MCWSISQLKKKISFCWSIGLTVSAHLFCVICLVEVFQLFVRDYVGYLYSVPVQFFGFRFKIADYSKTLLKVQLRLLNRGLIIAAQEAAAVAGTSGGESGSGKKATVRMR